MSSLHLSAGGLISKKQKRSPHFTRISLFILSFSVFFASAFLRGKDLFYLCQKLFGVYLPSRIIQLHQPFTVPAKHMIANRFAPLRAADMQVGKRRIFYGNFLGGRELMPLSPAIFLRSAFHSQYSYHIAFRHPVPGGSRYSAYSDAILLLLRSAYTAWFPNLVLSAVQSDAPRRSYKVPHPLYRLIHHPIKLIGAHVKSLLRRVNAFTASHQGFSYQAFQTHRRQIGVGAFLRQVKGFIIKVAAIIGSADNKNNAHQSQKRLYHAILAPVCVFIGDIAIPRPSPFFRRSLRISQ